MIHQQLGLPGTFSILVFAEDRHECLGKCAFRKHAAQQVWKFESDKKSVRRHPCTEDACHQHIAHKGQDARNQSQAADSSKGFKQIHELLK